jgi:alpha-tubulin suppressor-like RCC1 family protein
LPELPPGTYTTISVDYSIHDESGNWTAHLTACALSTADSLVCWRAFVSEDASGDVTAGQSVEHIPGTHVAAHVYGLEVCTVTADGSVNCEDWNGDGFSRYTSLALGGEFVCAITETGTIQCGRHDIQGVYFGDWGIRGLMDPPEPVADHEYAAVSVGYTRACALTDVGAAVCWGSVDNKLASPDPAPGGYVAVTDGYGHTCALTEDGLAVCWGWNNFGQANVPDGRYTAISAGFATTCAITEAGEPVCWGALTSRFAPSQASHTFPEGGYRAISTGYEAACALTNQGSPVCVGVWGLAWADTPPGPFVAITVGSTGHACALSDDGDVACWGGWELHGELDVPAGTWTALAAGDLQTCAIAADGDLICWGARPARLRDPPTERYRAVDTSGYDTCVLTDAGQMLCGDARDLVLSPLSEDLRVSQISVGPNRRCAVTEAGAVICWGDTEYVSRPFLNRHGYQPRYP